MPRDTSADSETMNARQHERFDALLEISAELWHAQDLDTLLQAVIVGRYYLD